MDITARITIRLYVDGQLKREDPCELRPEDFSTLLPRLAEQHAELLRGRLHVVEIEFLDEPNPDQRFFRFGTDCRRMAKPMPIDLKEYQA